MPGLPVCSIPQCILNHHEGACLELFQAKGPFEPTFIEAKQEYKSICNLGLLKSRIKTHSFLEEIITSSNEVFKDFVSDGVVGIMKLGNPTQETAKNNDTAKQTVGT